MSSAWLNAWMNAFGTDQPLWVLDLDSAGAVRAGTLLMRDRGRLASATNVHSGDWSVLAREQSAHAEVWRAIAEMGATRVRLEGLLEARGEDRLARSQLERAGYRVVQVEGPFSPWVELPSSWEEFIAAASGSLRQQVGRRRRQLDREGSVLFRTQTGGAASKRIWSASSRSRRRVEGRERDCDPQPARDGAPVSRLRSSRGRRWRAAPEHVTEAGCVCPLV